MNTFDLTEEAHTHLLVRCLLRMMLGIAQSNHITLLAQIKSVVNYCLARAPTSYTCAVIFFCLN